MIEGIYFSGQEWFGALMAILAVALGMILWAYHKAPVGRSVRRLCMGLKTLGIILLILCLFEPMATEERPKPKANMLAMVTDTSESLKLVDSGAGRSRGEILQNALLTKTDNWQNRLNEDFELKRYRFDSRLTNLTDFESLSFDGSASRLGDALRTLSRRFQGQPLAGILIFTDGVATDLESVLPDLTGFPPVYPVLVGEKDPERDLAVGEVTVAQTAFEDAPVTIDAQVRALGCKGEEITLRLEWLDSNGSARKVSREPAQLVGQDDAKLNFRFQVRPDSVGIVFYRLVVESSSEQTEATKANNSSIAVVDRGEGPYRVLYVSGRANWEFKFLRRALEEDDEVDLVGLIRIAKKEPKFTFKGRRGESSNPLFRGFKNEEQVAEEYDKPVLIRLNTRDGEELKNGFPTTAEELFPYSAIIIDDLEAGFFSSRQHALVQNFVSQRGGGLLMLGGQESFRQGKYERSSIGGMLPVYLDRLGPTRPLDELRLELTREGWLQPWTRLRDNENDENARLSKMVSFGAINQVRGNKPGARVLAKVREDGKNESHPALVTHQFGRGRVGAMLIGDLWRWGLKELEQRMDMDRSWRQTIRWLIADVPTSLEIYSSPERGGPGRSLELSVRDKNFEPLENAQVTFRIRPVGSAEEIPLSALHAIDKPGGYSTQFIPRASGGYLVEAEVRDEQGGFMGKRQAGWATDFAAAEYRSLTPNRALLDELARKTGGETLTLDQLEEFPNKISTLQAPVTEIIHSSLWHQAPIFVLAVACFAAEWFIRRRKGLA